MFMSSEKKEVGVLMVDVYGNIAYMYMYIWTHTMYVHAYLWKYSQLSAVKFNSIFT